VAFFGGNASIPSPYRRRVSLALFHLSDVISKERSDLEIFFFGRQFFLFEKQAIRSGRTTPHGYARQLPALETHSPAAMGKVFVPGDIVMLTLVAVYHLYRFNLTSQIPRPKAACYRESRPGSPLFLKRPCGISFREKNAYFWVSS